MASRWGGRGRLGRIQMPEPTVTTPILDLDDKCMMKFDELSNEIEVRAQDLEKIEELGRGAYGVVEKMRVKGTDIIMAVKMVRFYGAMFREGDVWICMEVMDISLDKFYRMCFDSGRQLPESFIAKCALAVVEGLNYMKEQMHLIHRDVKPSNILLNKQGAVKICDFGISGHLTNSVAKTVNAGCKPYMPPERIYGEKKVAYDVRADVWSLGITLVEIASGSHPYGKWKTPFEQLKQVVHEPAPRLTRSLGYSEEMHDFVSLCLTKDYNKRPKYPDLMAHKFLEKARNDRFNMGEYIMSVIGVAEKERKAVLDSIDMQNMSTTLEAMKMNDS